MNLTVAALAVVSAIHIQAAVEPSTSRSVTCHETDIIAVNTQVGYATLLRFNQPIAGAFWGDADRWTLDKQANLILLRPSVKGSKTDVHVVLTGGDVCSFTASEVSNDKGQNADIKLRIAAPNDKAEKPVFYSADEVEAIKRSAVEAQQALETEKAAERKRITEEKEAARTAQEASLQHKYRYEQTAKLSSVFGVRSIYRDDKFTYIEATPQEAPALYEIKDGKPSLIQYEFRDGKYIVPKLLNQGYLKVGKCKLDFAWEG